jgi:hypothetical protein
VLKRHSTKSKQIWEYLAQHEHFGWFYRREIVLHTTTQEEDTKPHTHTHTQKMKSSRHKMKKAQEIWKLELISIFNKFVTEIIIMKQAQKRTT